MIDHLDLNYLLVNYCIPINSTLPSIIELYEIKKYVCGLEKINKLLTYFRKNFCYLKLEIDYFRVNTKSAENYPKILEWLNSSNDYNNFLKQSNVFLNPI